MQGDSLDVFEYKIADQGMVKDVLYYKKMCERLERALHDAIKIIEKLEAGI